MKKFLRILLDTISVVIIIAAVIVLLNVAVVHKGEPPQLFGYSMFRVLTGSMEPEIPTGSMVIVKHQNTSDYVVGDVITFHSTDPTLKGSINTHRLIEITGEGNFTVFHTKGDANMIADPYSVDPSDVIGKVVVISKVLGFIVNLFSNPLIFAAVVVIPLIIVMICNIVNVVKTTKNIAETDDESSDNGITQETEAIDADAEVDKRIKELEDELSKLKKADNFSDDIE